MIRLPKFTTPTEALSYAAKHGIRIRIFYGDPATGKDDCDETDRSGRVTHTTQGAFLLHQNKGGSGLWLHTIETRRVVRVLVHRGRGWHEPPELYRHPSYDTGSWLSYYRSDLDKWIAIRNGLIHATFNTEAEAALYVDYITGKRASHRSTNAQVSFERLKRHARKG